MVRPEPSSHSVLGNTPMPTTNKSVSMIVPSVSSTASICSRPCTAVTPTPHRKSTPFDRCTSATTSPTMFPTTRSKGAANDSIRVVSTPLPTAVAATSAPMKPAPTTTSRRGPASSAVRIAKQSLRLRRVCTPFIPSVPGKVRQRAPVAISNPW